MRGVIGNTIGCEVVDDKIITQLVIVLPSLSTKELLAIFESSSGGIVEVTFGDVHLRP